VNHATDAQLLPSALTAAIVRAGYHPAIVCDVVAAALGGEAIEAHLVHQETTFDREAVRRHITVLGLTASRLLVVHADDHQDDQGGPIDVATATSESIPLRDVRGVMLTHVIPDPENYVPGSLGRELTLTLGWGAVSRVDLLPGGCADPSCDADHGLDGTITADDIALRVSADADGEGALGDAMTFARALSGALGRA
jgi:hypothetical protein